MKFPLVLEKEVGKVTLYCHKKIFLLLGNRMLLFHLHQKVESLVYVCAEEEVLSLFSIHCGREYEKRS